MSLIANANFVSGNPESETREAVSRGHLSLAQALGIGILTALGSAALFPMWSDAWNMWSSDPLRSIGAIFPPIALILVFWRWRQTGFRAEGSYWGLGPILLSILGARVFNAATLWIPIAGHRVGLLHPGMVLGCYGAGCVLLFGGPRLLRRTIFPLCLLLLLNPVPRAFNSVVDLPLQMLSANTARGFAHLIGLRPTGEQLKMMFAPDFGMMIVPGCNGVRGSITLFYLALIFGYTQRLPARALAALGLGAFLMGYALNLTRLCVLVIYYKIGLSWTSIQAYGVGIDYAIGCTIFLFATLSIGIAVRVYRQRHDILPETPLEAPERTSASLLPRAICFAALVLAFAIPQARAIVAAAQPKPTAEQVVAAMPPSVGSYRLTRTWTEHDTNGHVSLVMGDYTGPDSKRLTLGLWMGGESHFVANSKLYQGIRPQWNGAFDAMAQGSLPIHFLGNFYNDGVSRSYDAETACSSAGCRETLVLDKRTGLVFSAPSVAELAVAHTRRRLPILLRREWTDNAVPDAELRKSFEADARDFVSHLAIAPLIEQSGTYE